MTKKKNPKTPTAPRVPPPEHSAPDDASGGAARRHLRFGWWLLAISLTFGVVLELLHARKLPFYLGHDVETRRLMWTLAHAHGTLLGAVNILYALTLRVFGASRGALLSRCLIAGSVLLPLGFLLGGVILYGGDPGLMVLLSPVGALLIVVAAFMIARRAG